MKDDQTKVGVKKPDLNLTFNLVLEEHSWKTRIQKLFIVLQK